MYWDLYQQNYTALKRIAYSYSKQTNIRLMKSTKILCYMKRNQQILKTRSLTTDIHQVTHNQQVEASKSHKIN